MICKHVLDIPILNKLTAVAFFRDLLQNYKAKVACGYYEKLRPRSMRERLDELTKAVQQLARGQATSIASPTRVDVERDRAFGGISAEDEQAQHQQRLDRLGDEGPGTSLQGVASTCSQTVHGLDLLAVFA